MSSSEATIDLSAATIRAAGEAFSRTLEQLDLNAQRDLTQAGVLLLGELQRAGLSVSRPRRLLLIAALPAIDAPARVRHQWEGDHLEDTIEMPAPLHLLEAGE